MRETADQNNSEYGTYHAVANLYNPLETKRNQAFVLYKKIQMESNVGKAGRDGWYFLPVAFMTSA